MKFSHVFLGQGIIRLRAPLEIFTSLNEIYESKKKDLPDATKVLAGKITDEKSLFYNGKDTSKIMPHNFLSHDIVHWFDQTFREYLKFAHIHPYAMSMNSIWVNEMKAGEYNPIHTHRGNLFTGLSSVLILKIPKDYGTELTHPDQPMNGRLQFFGTGAGQFSKTGYSPNIRIGDFFIFPYDMRHCVNPFTNKKEKRRTLVCNMDVEYDEIATANAALWERNE
tara:strand:- start:306 stop:974 length:669 start_codon:yes stop_codon:yes gene_type:complete